MNRSLSRQVTKRVARELKPPLVSTARMRRDTAGPRPGRWDPLRIQAAITGWGAGHGQQLARTRQGFHLSRIRAAQRLVAERLRWKVADLLNHLPGQCWADLVSWALRRRGELGRRLPWQPIGEACRGDAASSPDGRCYCGKLRCGDG